MERKQGEILSAQVQIEGNLATDRDQPSGKVGFDALASFSQLSKKQASCATLTGMEIRNVAIIGVGAVGCLFGASINDALGKDHVQVVASGSRLARYRSQGMFLNGKLVDFDYVEPEHLRVADLVILATKNLQLEEAKEQIAKAVGPDTAILSLLNGTDSEEILARRYGAEHVLYAFAVGMSSEHSGNHIDFTSAGQIVFGEKDNSKSPRVLAIEDLFGRSGIAYTVPADIRQAQWKKFMLNTAFNTLSAITWSGYGDFTQPALLQLVRDVSSEVIAVAKAEGVELTEAMCEENIKTIDSLDRNGMTSMFQDMVAGRKTENEYFTGTVVRLGEKHRIPTPVCRVLHLVAQACEGSRSRAVREKIVRDSETKR